MIEIFFKTVDFFDGNLFFHEIIHGIIAAPFAYILYKKTKNKIHVFAMFLVTYLVDADHLVDYFLHEGPIVNINKMLAMKFFEQSGHIYVPFHAWEYIILLVLLTKKYKHPIFKILLFGLLPHYIWDAFTVWNVMFYSISVRAIHAFTFFP